MTGQPSLAALSRQLGHLIDPTPAQRIRERRPAPGAVKVPVWQMISDHYRNEITTGRIPAGTQLLTQPEMAAQYRVSGSTIHRAMAPLKREGLIYTTHDGTYAGPRKEGTS